jgi:hypothetical protein
MGRAKPPSSEEDQSAMRSQMSAAIRLGLLCVPALSCSLAAAPVVGQPAITAEAQSYGKACMDNASSTHNVIQTGDRLIYSCWGTSAQNYYDFLVSKNAPESVDKQPTGTYIFREIPQTGRCWNKVEHVDGIETNWFGCSINVAKSSQSAAR